MQTHPAQTPPTPPQPPSSYASGPPKRPPANRRESIRSIFSTVAILLLAPIIALFLISFVFQSYLVDGPSMQSTLHNNDRLIVWKLPRTWSRLTGHAYIPHRGDIIVFTDPDLARFGQDPEKQLIKRVIGLPGERLVVKDQVVTVYNSQYPKGFQPDITLPYQRTATDTNGDLDIVIPNGKIFVMGDNRTNSLDSRAFGPVDSSNIVGKLAVRILPASQIKRF